MIRPFILLGDVWGWEKVWFSGIVPADTPGPRYLATSCLTRAIAELDAEVVVVIDDLAAVYEWNIL